MAITANWLTKTFSVPQSDLTFITGTLYEMNTETDFRQAINAVMASEEGICFSDPIRHNTEVTVAGTTFSRTIEIINGYSITFTPNSQWTVRLSGSNNNLFDVENGILNQNQVQVIAQNSAGLQTVTQGSGLSSAQDTKLTEIHQLAGNKMVTDPATGIMTIYDTDGVTPLYTAQLYEDAAGTQTYRGQGAERREKIT